MNAPKMSPPGPVATAAIDVIPHCPLDLSQRSCACLGYYERGPLRLQIRMLMHDNEGVCTVLVEEDEGFVTIRVIACRSDESLDGLSYPGYAEERHHVWIEAPLGGRRVIDYETGKPMPFYVPTYENGRPTKAPGYYTDRDAALAGWEVVADIDDRRSRPRHDAPRRSRTLGY